MSFQCLSRSPKIEPKVSVSTKHGPEHLSKKTGQDVDTVFKHLDVTKIFNDIASEIEKVSANDPIGTESGTRLRKYGKLTDIPTDVCEDIDQRGRGSK